MRSFLFCWPLTIPVAAMHHFSALTVLFFLFSAAVLSWFSSTSATRTKSALAHALATPAAPVPFTCTPAQLRSQSDYLIPQILIFSSCPGQALWPLLVEAGGLACKPAVVMDVGANKGYTIAGLMDLFLPELGITSAALYPFLQATLASAGQDAACGVCHDCMEGHMETTMSHSCVLPSGAIVSTSHIPTVFYGVEPHPSNVQALQEGLVIRFERQSVAVGSNSSSLHILQLAMGAKVGVVDFMLCEAGSEGCGVAEEGRDSSLVVSVPSKTVDGLAAELGIEHIDVLLIDTEGLDPEVLDGARALLSRQAVSILVFEYHALRAWAVTSLETVTDDLDASFGLTTPLPYQVAHFSVTQSIKPPSHSK